MPGASANKGHLRRQLGVGFDTLERSVSKTPYLKFRVLMLFASGYMVRPDIAGSAVADVHDGNPIQPPRTYGFGHVTLYIPDMS